MFFAINIVLYAKIIAYIHVIIQVKNERIRRRVPNLWALLGNHRDFIYFESYRPLQMQLLWAMLN